MTLPRVSRCAHLTGKAMYYQLIDGRPSCEPREPTLALLEDGGTWWCIKTLTRLGPDSEPVGKAFCDAARPCYEPDEGLSPA